MDGCFYHFTPAFLIGSDINVQQGPFAPWALPHFIATTDLAVTVSPAVDFPVVPVIRLRCSIGFSMVRGRLLQLLSTSLSSYCPYPPRRSVAPYQSACVASCCLRLTIESSASRVYFLSRPPLGSLALRPGDSLTIL